MDPFTSTICTLGSAISLIISNPAATISNIAQGTIGSMIASPADRTLCSVMKSLSERLQRCGEPLNHDLQKAVRRAYLEATLFISEVCKDFVSSRDEIKSLDILCKKLNKEIDNLSKAKYIPPNNAALREVELLLQPGDVTPLERLKEFQDKLKKSVISEIMLWHKTEGWQYAIPDKLLEMIETDWFNKMSLYFSEILKTDQKVQAIFQSGLLTDVSFRLESLTEAFENFGKTALEGIRRINGKVDNLTDLFKKLQDATPEQFAAISRQIERLQQALIEEGRHRQTSLRKSVGKIMLEKHFVDREAYLRKVGRLYC